MSESDYGDEDLEQELRRVRQENVQLKRNFESLKGVHLQLSSAHKQLQGSHAALQEERMSVEKQYQSLCESWRLELAEKQRSFEAAKAQILGPRDLDLIKVKLLEEVEGPYKHKCDVLAQEAEMAQQSFVRLRREHEELLVKHKNMELRYAGQIEAMVDEHTAAVCQLKDQLAALGKPQEKIIALEAQLHALNREHNNQAFMVVKLKDELQDMRRQKERATVEKEAASLQVERKNKDIQAEEMQMTSMVESLSRKNRYLLKELEEAQRSNEDQYAQLIKANSERSMLADQIEALRKATSIEKQMAQRQMEETIQRLEDTLSGLREELHERECQVAELHMTHQEQVARLVEAQDARLSQAEAEAVEKGREARRHQMELQAKLDALKDTCEEYKFECEDYKRQANLKAEAAARETQRLQGLLAEAEQEAAARVAEVQELRGDLAKALAESKDLNLSNGHLSRRKEELDLQVKRLQQEVQDVNTDRQALGKELEEIRKCLLSEQAAQLAHIESTRQSANVERAAVAKKYQANLKDQQHKHEAEVRLLKKQLRSTRAEVVELTDELLQHKMRSHELEATLGGLTGPIKAFAAGGKAAHGDLVPQPDKEKGVVGADVMASMSALKQRQQLYMEAVGCE